MSFWPTFIGILVAAVLLTIAYKVFWAKLSQQSSRSGQDTLPVHQPRPVSQPPRPPPPSQSYQLSPYTPPVRQLEQHQPVYRPPPPAAAPPAFPVRPPLPSQSYQSSPYTPPVHQPEQHQPVSQPPPHRPPPSQSYGSSPHTPPSPHGPPKYEDVNQQDQPNEYYIGLRARANKEGDEMARCFDERHKANSRGDRAAAKVLSKQGKIHKQEMEQLNKEASDWIYLENNRDRKPGEIDLHGLYVKEAIARTYAALEEAKLRGDSEIRLIVGKGLHSEGGIAKVRPAIQELMRKYQLVAEFDPSNSGVLVVELNGLTPIRHRRHLNISHRHGRRRASNIGA
ncbi:DUF1771-domain-containing protein [Armillaria solidipes]|uniref:DUF1771-domain-containing protein n=1 Tax=Armillaria solidipes TaxID=1076256 RepID=A0A2H3B8M4_9AGAR|nr:DUF1771-domain-containing protein [Armillaria solidipes]